MWFNDLVPGKNTADAESEKAIWIDEAADVINGNILTLKFQVSDNAPDGLAEVTVTGFKAAALDESAVNANIVTGGVHKLDLGRCE